MKSLFYCVLLCTPVLACSQGNTKDMYQIDIRNELKNLKRFEQEPIYQIRVNSAYAYTVSINGIPIINKNTPFTRNYLTEINPCIPETGKQKIDINIFPEYTGMRTPAQEQDLVFELKIEKTAWKDGILEEPEVIYTYNLPHKVHADKKIFTHSDVFHAEVPYQLIDWRQGGTFNKQDTTDLKEKALEVYQQIVSHYENQDGEAYVNAIGKGLFNLYQASYFDQNEASDHLEHSIAFVNKKKRNLQELEKYELQILADGKLLSLRRIDHLNRGEGIIRRQYKKGPKERVHIHDMLLYAPQASSKDEPLQVIWYNNLVRGVD